MSNKSIEKLCRICVNQSNSYYSIYDKYIHNDSRLFEVINNVCQLDINVDDGLPEFICYDCHIKIAEFQIFKKNSHKSKEVLLCLKDKFQKEVYEAEENHSVITEIPEGTPSLVNVKTDEMIEYTNLNSLTSVGRIHAEEASESCTEIDLIPMKLEYDDSITTDEIGAVNALPQEDPLKLELDESKIFIDDQPEEEALHEEINELSEDAANMFCSNPAGSFLNDKEAEIPRGISLLAGEHGKRFNNIYNSKHHKMVNNGENPLICDNNCTLVKNGKNLKKHKMVYRGKKALICDTCGKKYTRSSNLKAHMRVHSGEKPFVCIECNKSFTEKRTLTIHMSVHSGEKSFVCVECNKCFSRNFSLKTHMRLHSRKKPFVCDECGKSFSDTRNFAKHIRVHRGEKPFGCDKCNKFFSRMDSLKRHMKVHSGEKPFVCVECNKCFTEKGNLKIHMRVHSGEKPFECVECKKCFSRNGSLKIHMWVHNSIMFPLP